VHASTQRRLTLHLPRLDLAVSFKLDRKGRFSSPRGQRIKMSGSVRYVRYIIFAIFVSNAHTIFGSRERIMIFVTRDWLSCISSIPPRNNDYQIPKSCSTRRKNGEIAYRQKQENRKTWSRQHSRLRQLLPRLLQSIKQTPRQTPPPTLEQFQVCHHQVRMVHA